MRIGIVGIPGELSPLYQRVDGIIARERTPVMEVARARWAGHDVFLAACGVGKVNAALATMALIQRSRPEVILNCGSAGALAPDLRIGDIVISLRVTTHDTGAYLEKRFAPTGIRLPSEHMRWLYASPLLVERARAAAEALGWGSLGGHPRVMEGVIATGDQVIFSHAHKERITRETGAVAVEQEGAAVAHVAHVYGVPWLVIRGISDTADSKAGFDYTRWIVYADDPPPLGSLGRSWFRVSRQVTRPLSWRRARRFRRGVRVAMTHVAQLVEEMLSRQVDTSV
ncbi:MAG TPA: 5'-methylthioadenosine/S-adenosylhomocysteine nucleosidase [Caldilineae bacterium]|nr:5'-methylthioadenosine/S-adenosylhomocysteine nucleosidase [Caldilineae bacterium]